MSVHYVITLKIQPSLFKGCTHFDIKMMTTADLIDLFFAVYYAVYKRYKVYKHLGSPIQYSSHAKL